MMKKKFRDYQPDQLMLMPPAINDWLPDDHVVHFVSEVVDEALDLSAIFSDYSDPRGQPPYHPAMMVKVWLYGYMCGIRSSRKLERALHEDVGFRVLSGNQQPDFWTLAAFRRRHLEALGQLFVQTVKLAEQAELLPLKAVATDGTKVRANASKHKAMSYGRMDGRMEDLRREIEDYLAEVDRNDQAEDEQFGPDRRGDELPEHLQTKAGRIEAIRRARAELEARARAKAEAEQEQRQADAGFFSAVNLAFLTQHGIEVFIPPDRIKHNEWYRQPPPEAALSEDTSLAEQMRQKLRTPVGRETYQQRQTSVEPVFGQLKEALGFRRFLLRGIEKASSEWRFVCAAHNLWKLFRAGADPRAVRA